MFMIFSESKTKKIIPPTNKINISYPSQPVNTFNNGMFARIQNATKCKTCGN